MKTKNLNITIIDNDSFFTLGLKNIITNHYNSINIKVNFIQPIFDNTVNILFQYDSAGIKPQLHQDGRENFIEFEKYFSIKDELPKHKKHETSIIPKKAGEISKKMTIKEVIDCISSEITITEDIPKTLSHRDITKREWCVINCFQQEMGVKKTAKVLRISNKTVCSHKYSIMKKLGFKRSYELYFWIRNLSRKINSTHSYSKNSIRE